MHRLVINRGVSPAHDAPGGVLLLDAAHGLRLRRASRPETPWPRRYPQLFPRQSTRRTGTPEPAGGTARKARSAGDCLEVEVPPAVSWGIGEPANLPAGLGYHGFEFLSIELPDVVVVDGMAKAGIG